MCQVTPSKIAFNVSAVYEGFYGAIKKTAKLFCAIKTLGGVSRGNEAQRNDLGELNPEGL
jgi:hypothetical protein